MTPCFYETRRENKPGIYVCYFPHNKKVYIGMSQNIKNELKILQSNKEKRQRIREAFSQSGENTKTYALLQGDILDNINLRRFLENQFISNAGSSALNIVGQNKINYPIYIGNPLIPTPEFKPLMGDWSKYGLHFSNLNTDNHESFIYLFMNLSTKRFYIGQTGIGNFKQRFIHHRRFTAQRALDLVEKKN